MRTKSRTEQDLRSVGTFVFTLHSVVFTLHSAMYMQLNDYQWDLSAKKKQKRRCTDGPPTDQNFCWPCIV